MDGHGEDYEQRIRSVIPSAARDPTKAGYAMLP
jgi:hypothetical protein